VNCWNSQIWSDENCHFVREVYFQYQFSVNIWCGVVCDFMFGSFLFQQLHTGVGFF
jgi:hypothetical protein